ncbi:hypothetical protein Cpir12675_000415 [Ceratocystis pirilliformis]|uniref:Uncharacterized protein n=1 Tax=Ceratocystis pirilliformis TaxID=259994 RepID=A0ABR3ZLK8_9PEZI
MAPCPSQKKRRASKKLAKLLFVCQESPESPRFSKSTSQNKPTKPRPTEIKVRRRVKKFKSNIEKENSIAVAPDAVVETSGETQCAPVARKKPPNKRPVGYVPIAPALAPNTIPATPILEPATLDTFAQPLRPIFPPSEVHPSPVKNQNTTTGGIAPRFQDTYSDYVRLPDNQPTNEIPASCTSNVKSRLIESSYALHSLRTNESCAQPQHYLGKAVPDLAKEKPCSQQCQRSSDPAEISCSYTPARATETYSSTSDSSETHIGQIDSLLILSPASIRPKLALGMPVLSRAHTDKEIHLKMGISYITN